MKRGSNEVLIIKIRGMKLDTFLVANYEDWAVGRRWSLLAILLKREQPGRSPIGYIKERLAIGYVKGYITYSSLRKRRASWALALLFLLPTSVVQA